MLLVLAASGCVGTMLMLRGKNVSLGIIQDQTGYARVQTIEDVAQVYPLTVKEMQARAEYAKKDLKKNIDALVALKSEEQNRQTVLLGLDKADVYFSNLLGQIELIHMVCPDKEVREIGTQLSQELQNFHTDLISQNKPLYQVIKNYADTTAQNENLTSAEQLFLKETLAGFKRGGMELPEDQLAQVTELRKQLSKLSTQFQVVINNDNRTVVVTKEDLKGLSDEFIATLGTTDDGLYILKTDYPTSDMIMRYCGVSDTRKKFYKANTNKGYPENIKILDDIIRLRSELAKKLGFKSYAHYSLDDKMVNDPKKAWKLQEDVLEKALKKAQKEIQHFSQDLPEGVTLTKDGKFQPWDLGYTTNYFKKKYYDIDELQIAEYFPMEQTIQGLFNIYQKFFDLEFSEIKNVKAWHDQVRLLQIKRKDGQLCGYVFIDMFPRDNKYGHAAQFHGIEAHVADDGVYYPAVCTVVCNFTPATKEKPSLLKYDEVNTFFHEFGHALHTLLGGQKLVSQSGTSVKRDFVEMPSQMLENWIEQKDIIKDLSKHYKTGEQLPDDLIDKKLELLKLSTGLFESRQIGLGMLALACFDESPEKNTDVLVEKYTKLVAPYLLFDSETHFQCSFGHLTGYGAGYYGYLWSRILSTDLFEYIKKEGLLNPQAGKRYADAILAPGSSQDPFVMVHNYLGREPNQKAFLKKNGFEE